MNRQLTISAGLIQYDDKFLITRRFNPEHTAWHRRWELPGGKIQAGETPLAALHREIMEETNLTIHTPQLLGVHTHFWQVAGTQQTFILLYHCFAAHQNVHLNPNENDAYLWAHLESILERDDLLDGMVVMLNELYLKKPCLQGK